MILNLFIALAHAPSRNLLTEYSYVKQFYSIEDHTYLSGKRVDPGLNKMVGDLIVRLVLIASIL